LYLYGEHSGSCTTSTGGSAAFARKPLKNLDSAIFGGYASHAIIVEHAITQFSQNRRNLINRYFAKLFIWE